jgi:hypothetical protein
MTLDVGIKTDLLIKKLTGQLSLHTETFNIRDLYSDKLLARANAEARKIYSKSSTRNYRSLNKVVQDCLKGQTAELFLIDLCGYRDNPEPYMDLYTPGGAELEVKVTEKATNAVFILNKLNERKAWGNVANLVYIYILDNKSGDINFLSEYKYNGQRYVLCT